MSGASTEAYCEVLDIMREAPPRPHGAEREEFLVDKLRDALAGSFLLRAAIRPHLAEGEDPDEAVARLAAEADREKRRADELDARVEAVAEEAEAAMQREDALLGRVEDLDRTCAEWRRRAELAEHELAGLVRASGAGGG